MIWLKALECVKAWDYSFSLPLSISAIDWLVIESWQIKDEGIGEEAGVQISLGRREMAESTASPSQHPRVSGSFSFFSLFLLRLIQWLMEARVTVYFFLVYWLIRAIESHLCLENVIRFCVLFWGQGAELMGKYGVNVPKGVAVSSLDQVKKAIDQVFPNESEVCALFSKRELNLILIFS